MVSESLAGIGMDYAALESCATFQDEWNRVRKAFHKRCRVTHPDKDGDVQDFYRVMESFEFLKRIYKTGKANSFTTATDDDADEEEPPMNEQDGSGVVGGNNNNAEQSDDEHMRILADASGGGGGDGGNNNNA